MVKTPVVIKEDYIIYFEPVDAGVVIHCDVFKWNKTIKGKLKQDFETLKTLHEQPILAMHQIQQGNKHIKFLKMFGFKLFEQVKDLKGNQVDFYITNEDKNHG
jgi:hypothetical protein